MAQGDVNQSVIQRIRAWAKRNPALASVIGIAVGAAISFLVVEAIKAANSRLPRDPVHVSVSFDNDRYDEGFEMVMPETLQPRSVAAQGSCVDLHEFGLAQGGVDSGHTFLKLIVQGAVEKPVVITGMRAETVERTELEPPAQLECPSGAAEDIISLRFNLDDPNPTALKMKSGDEVVGQYFRKKSVTVAPGESVPFSIWAAACNFNYAWRIVIDLVVDGDEKTMTIDMDGKPFRTNGQIRPREWWAYTGAKHLEPLDPSSYVSEC